MSRATGVLISTIALSIASTTAVAVELLPHRAVYDVTLRDATASANVVSGSGRLVLEVSGSECDGYVTTMRDVTRVTDRDGNVQTTDQRLSTFETLDPATFTFMNEVLIDGEQASRLKGEARAMADGLHISVSEPKETEFTLPRAVFPTMHTRLLLEAAAAGEDAFQVMLYPADEVGSTLYETTAMIGTAETGLPDANPAERQALAVLPDAANEASYPITISYFRVDDAVGEQTASTEIALKILDNGIAYDMVFDYGSFALDAQLAELELLPIDPC